MKPDLTVALAGNANVGKSSIFNQLTGLGQTIGNWPGKTVEKAEGILLHHNKHINIIDLPGIYSLSTYSQEELVSRDYIALQHPDVVINVVDATALERNLFFTIQLLEMGAPLIIALNLVDDAKKKGIIVDEHKLSQALGVPVIPTIATKGIGVHDIIDIALQHTQTHKQTPPPILRYGPEIETRIEKLLTLLTPLALPYPLRWTAIKLLEGDTEIITKVEQHNSEVIIAASILRNEISQIHKEPCSIVITSERYAIAARIQEAVQTNIASPKPTMIERFDELSMHGVWGYLLMAVIMLSILTIMSVFGGWFSELTTQFFESINPQLTGFWADLAWNGAVVGFYATLSVALGFILPFYLLLGLLEDSGYLPKVAYLMDRPCHTIGLHGKACIPLLLAFGCNVPACVGCRIMETKRDKLLAMILSTLVPCSARTVVIIGLVGVYVGVQWALALYLIDFILIVLIGRFLNRILPGTSVGIIMEMPPYRRPSAKVIMTQAWHRFKPFLLTAIPLIIIGSIIIEAMRLTSVLSYVSDALSPVTVLWLGLPAFTGFLFIFGILRKEAALVLLMTAAGTTELQTVMTPVQMIVFAFVIMLYIPCIATIAALLKETGWRHTTLITLSEIGLAVLLGGILYRVLTLLTIV